jgi:RND family efflux transporter MFP subunit
VSGPPETSRREAAAPPGAEAPAARPLREELAALHLPPEAKDGAGPASRRRHGVRRALLALLLLALVAGAAWRLLAPRALAVEVATAVALDEAAREPVPVLSGTGYLVPAQPFIAIGSRIAGRIERYRVEEGDRVAQGDALVELDAAPYQAVVDQLRSSLESARARLDLAESEVARAARLFEGRVTSREELDRRESETRVARAQVDELEASLSRARIDLADSVIRAPTDGVVLETFKQPGEIAVPGGFAGSGDLLRLANLAEIRAELDVNEVDLPRVRLDQDAEVVPDAFPDARYAARVVKLAPQIDRQKGTRKVEVRVLEPDERLLPDMSVRVTFLAELERGVAANAGGAVIPRAALRRSADGRADVWVVVDGRARRTPVEVGDTLGERVVVRAGLRGGEQVLVGAAPERDGQRVEVEAAAPPGD